jgi:alpha-galactosidase
MGLSQYVPLQTACVWIPNAYDVRSASTGGLLCQFGYMDSDFPEERAERLIAEAKENQKYWYGDFYSLTQANLDPASFTAYQLHRPDLDAGVVYAYRRPETTYRGLILGLNGIDKSAQYDVVMIDDNGGRTSSLVSGAELASDFALRAPEGSFSVVVRYAKH